MYLGCWQAGASNLCAILGQKIAVLTPGEESDINLLPVVPACFSISGRVFGSSTKLLFMWATISLTSWSVLGFIRLPKK